MGRAKQSAEIAKAAPSKILCSDGVRRIPWTETVSGIPLTLADGTKVCGARKRGDKFDGKNWACANTTINKNGRCRIHGGRNSGAPIKTGAYSKFLPPGWLAGYEESVGKAERARLDEEINLVNGALVDALSKLRSGATDEQIAQAKELFDQATLCGNVEALKDLGLLLNSIEIAPEAEERVWRIVEQKRKLVEAVDRQEARQATNLSEREMRSAAQVMIAILIQVVNDPTIERHLIPNHVGIRFASHFGRPVSPGTDE